MKCKHGLFLISNRSGKSQRIFLFLMSAHHEFSLTETLACKVPPFCFLLSGVILDWWRQILSTSLKRPHWHPTLLCLVQQDKNFAKFAAIIDVFDLLE